MSKMYGRKRARSAHAEPSTRTFGGLPPEGANPRQARLEHILLDEIQSLIRDEATDPALEGVRLLAVNMSPDGGHARVAYAVDAALDREHILEQASKAGLARATGFLRARLADQLHLKKLPKLTFTFVGIDATEGSPSPLKGGEPCHE